MHVVVVEGGLLYPRGQGKLIKHTNHKTKLYYFTVPLEDRIPSHMYYCAFIIAVLFSVRLTEGNASLSLFV